MNGYEIEHNLEQRLRNWSLSPIAQLLYLKLKIIANEQGIITKKFKVSNEELMFRVGISASALRNARNDLLKSGILGYNTGGKNGSRKTFGDYWFIDLRVFIKHTNEHTNEHTKHTLNIFKTKTNIKENLKEKISESFNFDFVDENFKAIFFDWLEYKRIRRESYKTQKSVELCYQKLLKLSKNNPEIAVEVVNETMSNNYAGLIQLKNIANQASMTLKLSNGTVETTDLENDLLPVDKITELLLYPSQTRSWRDKFTKNNKISESELKGFLSDFLVDNQEKMKLERTVMDFVSHFVNWYKAKKRKEE
jgi:hypothetical protein